jgi:hypothetical protein
MTVHMLAIINILCYYNLNRSLKQKGTIMEAHEVKKPVGKDALIERFVRNQEELRDLHELKRGLSQEWSEDGFDEPAVYVDGHGKSITIAERRADEEEQANDESKTYRFLYDGDMHDVVIPSGFQGFDIDTRGSGGTRFIYTLHPDEDPMSFMMEDENGELPPLPEVTDSLAELVGKFGDTLEITDAGMGGAYSKTLTSDLVVAYELDGITQDAAYRRSQTS